MVLGISSGIRDGLVDFGGFQVDFVVFLGVLVVWWISGGFQVDFWCVSRGFSCCGMCLVEFRLVCWISGGFCGSGMFLV